MSEQLADAPSLTERLHHLSQYDLAKDIPVLEVHFLGNSIYAYILTVLSFFLLWPAFSWLRRYLVRRSGSLAAAYPRSFWVFAQTFLCQIKPSTLTLLAFYCSTKRLAMSPPLERGLYLITTAVVTIQVVQLLGEIVRALIMRTRGGKSDDPVMRNTTNNLTTIAMVALWIAGVLFFMDNAGYNVSTFVGGLGIGAVAIALAAQAILGDTFSSFAIALDKPFEPGDFINVDSLQGTVEHIGLKTTRIRSIGGELLVFSNSDLTKSRIRNFKRMEQRRASLKILVHPETPNSKIKLVPDLLKAAVEGRSQTKLSQAGFTSISEVGLTFDAVYYVMSDDYPLFVKTQQEINYQLLDSFAREGIKLAYNPTNAIVFSN